MKKFFVSILFFQIFILSCSSNKPKENLEINEEISQLEDDLNSEFSAEIGDDMEFDDGGEESLDFQQAESESGDEASDSVDEFAAFDEGEEDLNFEGEVQEQQLEETQVADLQEEESLEPLQEMVPESVPQEPEQNMGMMEVSEPDPLTEEEREFESAFSTPPVDIKDISFLANQSGGTVVIKVDSEFYFKTRSNIENKQYIIEIANANLADSLKRPYLLKEFKGASFAAINAYQKPGSSVARVVIQLKEATSPIVQKEGNTLLIIPPTNKEKVSTQVAEASPNDNLQVAQGVSGNLALESEAVDDPNLNIDYSKGGTPEAYPEYQVAEETKNLLLSARTLDEFLLKHRKYYGKPISLQVDKIGVKDVLEMIAEEAGLNLALPNSLGGEVTLKLRKVPWDQAFILILRSNRLGYVREGNVIRVDTLNNLSREITNAQAIIDRRNETEPLQIKIIPVSYLALADAVTKLNSLKSKKGVVISDAQTNSLIVTEVEENIVKMEKLLEAIDIPPKQVLIEGKIIEAVESFSKGLGLNWSASGTPKILSQTGGVGGSPITVNPSLAISPVDQNFAGIANLNLNIGVLDVLGSLNAKIALLEANNLAKVISSPRIITLTGEPANFTQTLAVPFVNSTAQTSAVAGAVNTVQTVDIQRFTLNFKVTPVISSDNSIRLDLNVSRTNPTAGATLSGMVSTSTSSAQTKVIVGNNQTAVIGGIYSGSETSAVNKVPVLGNIPILGWLFKSEAKENSKTELVIFVTPRIIDQSRVITSLPSSREVIDEQGLSSNKNSNNDFEEGSRIQ